MGEAVAWCLTTTRRDDSAQQKCSECSTMALTLHSACRSPTLPARGEKDRRMSIGMRVQGCVVRRLVTRAEARDESGERGSLHSSTRSRGLAALACVRGDVAGLAGFLLCDGSSHSQMHQCLYLHHLVDNNRRVWNTGICNFSSILILSVLSTLNDKIWLVIVRIMICIPPRRRRTR